MLYRGPLGGGAASGKIGAMVASHNSGGQYLRARTTPTDPSTAQQQVVRAAVAELAGAYAQLLTTAQREAWAVFGQNGGFVNRLGDPITLSGIAAYIRNNAPRVAAGFDSIDDAPTVFLQTPTNVAAVIPTVTAPDTVSIAFDNTDPWADTDDGHLLIYVSPPQNPAILFYKGPYRLLDTIDGSTSAAPTSPHAATYAPAAFGALIANQRLFFQFRSVGADGNIGNLFRATTVAL